MKRSLADQILTAGMTEGEARLWRFCEAVEQGHKPDKRDLQTVAKSFRQMLDGVPPKKALGLEKPRGRKQPTLNDTEPHFQIAVEVVERMKTVSYEKAVVEVSLKHGKSVKTVQRYYARHKEVAQYLVALLRKRKPADKK